MLGDNKISGDVFNGMYYSFIQYNIKSFNKGLVYVGIQNVGSKDKPVKCHMYYKIKPDTMDNFFKFKDQLNKLKKMSTD